MLMSGYDLSIIALIGIILLIGIVKKNAIADRFRARGGAQGGGAARGDHQACLLRFRPIMMTTMAAPSAAAAGAGAGAGAELPSPWASPSSAGCWSQWLTLYRRR
jgi:multidrug efflux pump subunit AcrB